MDYQWEVFGLTDNYGVNLYSRSVITNEWMN